MIYITGDTHGHIDIGKIYDFCNKTTLTENDYLIVAGDFGVIWTGGTRDRDLIEWWNNMPFTTLFVDGNHENHERLNNYRQEKWNGGKMHIITPKIYHLMRGEYYTIEGKTFFTLGGAVSIDRKYRVPRLTWWEEEVPDENELKYAEKNLKKHGNKVDYIITHCCSSKTQNKLNPDFKTDEFTDELNKYELVDFKKWFFGHYHLDCQVDEKHVCLYKNFEVV